MLDRSSDSNINHCVQCESKFTSSERPLKLLPCLHSMCLDCLSGRIPVKKLESVSKLKPKCVENTEITNTDDDGVTDNTTEKVASNSEESDNKAENAENNAVLESTAAKASVGDSEQTDDSAPKDVADAVISDSDGTDKNENNEDSDKIKDSSPSGLVENDPVTSTICSPADSINDQKDVKPTPAKECPICKDPITVPFASLMDNMFATLDSEQAESSDVDVAHVCTACEEGQEANSYCIQCEEWLCGSCVDAHKRVRVTKDHVISPKDQVPAATSKSPWEQQMMCKLHRQEPMKFFCEKCETMTCRDCQLMDHKEHKYQFLDQAADQYKARLKGSLALMGEKKQKLAASRSEIAQKLSNCKEQKESVQADILRQADVLVKKIRQAVWGVLSNLASFTDAATKRLNKEIDDVSDLIGKFDHCVQFMEDILQNGTSMSLLYSKGSVEAKCRKVYHTQVDPQSLKGNLNIQYKHDVNCLLGNLNKIGAIFVNGVRYPPEKPGSHSQRPPHANGSAQQQDNRPGMSPHLQNLANQPVPGQRGPAMGDDWTKFIQAVTKPVSLGQMSLAGPPNMSITQMAGGGGSLPSHLTLPSRRSSSASAGHTWAGMQGSNFPNHFQQQGQQIMSQPQGPHGGQQSKPSFTPMRLHHRPATHPTFSNQGDRGSGTMRSPPCRQGGAEASGGTGNHSRSNHGTPDPARPASAGMYNDGNSRPDNGSPALIDVKKERRDQSPDCVITSSNGRGEKQGYFQSSPVNSRVSETALEMQKSLDEVILNVPMDLSENMEQISGSKPDDRTGGASTEAPNSPTAEELRVNWQGGNSMPGFSNPSSLQVDFNDDYCACCHNGGDVLCCDTCPRVFHLQCHIPEIPSVPSGSFVCTICEGDKPMEPEDASPLGKRKSGMSDNDLKVCERILLDLFCHPSSIPFHEAVNTEQVPNYYKIITQPRDFSLIRSKLQKRDANHYQSVKGVLYDLRQVFINCAMYNKGTSEVGKAGRMVRELFENLVSKLMPQFLEFVKENPTPCFSALYRQADLDLPESVVSIEQAQAVVNKDGAKLPENGCEPTSPKRLKIDLATEGSG